MIKFNQTGFTLVEIAIVLVIIGLLLGGILKGQELINSARVRNLADQNSAVQAAYYGFIDRYRQVPGDMIDTVACDALGESNFPQGCVGGDPSDNGGNGRIDTYDEALAVWAHLSIAGFITGVYPGVEGPAGYDSTVAPVNAFQGPVYLIYSDEYEVAGTTPATNRLAYFFGRGIPVNIARELDVKLDDGNPQTGILRASTSGDHPSISDEACVSETGIWDIEANAQDCNSVLLY